MGALKTFCGIAVAVLMLTGCGGGGSGANSSAASVATSPPPSSSTPSPTVDNSATLSWTAPSDNSNGSALTDLAGYHIYYGTTPGALTNTVNITNPGTLSYTVTNLGAGTWYFAISAYTNSGLQSAMSNVGSKTIT